MEWTTPWGSGRHRWGRCRTSTRCAPAAFLLDLRSGQGETRRLHPAHSTAPAPPDARHSAPLATRVRTTHRVGAHRWTAVRIVVRAPDGLGAHRVGAPHRTGAHPSARWCGHRCRATTVSTTAWARSTAAGAPGLSTPSRTPAEHLPCRVRPPPPGRRGRLRPATAGPAQAAGRHLPGRGRPCQVTSAAFHQHSGSEVLLSFPGLGPQLAARVLAEIGDDRTRCTDGRALRSYAGSAPITRASGKKRFVGRRFVRNNRFMHAGFLWAFSALQAPPGGQRPPPASARARRLAQHRPAPPAQPLPRTAPPLSPDPAAVRRTRRLRVTPSSACMTREPVLLGQREQSWGSLD